MFRFFLKSFKFFAATILHFKPFLACDCDPSGTEGDVCDKNTGQCLCRDGFAGRRCDQCDERFYGYPNCRACACNAKGSANLQCDITTGECECHANFTSRTCEKCAGNRLDKFESKYWSQDCNSEFKFTF